jgi:hypothetical protein
MEGVRREASRIQTRAVADLVLVIGAKYVLQLGTMFHDCSWFYGIPL